MTERRRFNQRERNFAYLAADGRCERCGVELSAFHTDHITPYARGGRTALNNGQALCPPCNLAKGASMDSVKLRPFQEELASRVLDRISASEEITVAWVNAGSGKTLGWLHAANELFRQGQIDGVVCLVPRLNLRKQAELDWCRAPGSLSAIDPGGFMHLYTDPRMGLIVARDNKHARPTADAPIQSITESRHFGYVSTYASLVSDPGIHYRWAREHAGRFLLVADEAQFLGVNDDEGGGTAAGTYVKQLADLALHTVLLTGTPYRSDKNQIALANYTEPDAKGERHLEWHVRATYRQGVSGGYLREFQYDLNHGTGSFTDDSEFDITTLENRLHVVLHDARVWQGLVDSTVARLGEVRRLDSQYQALICASDQDQAEHVIRYLRAQHPSLRPMLAISRQGSTDSQNALDSFRSGHGDVLVTVAKAYIGYDCKQITVVGLLTSKRWDGWLQQIVARGLRMWSDRPSEEQVCYIVGPADRELRKFCEKMRIDAEDGLRDRGGEGGDAPTPGEAVEVDDYQAGGTEMLGVNPGGDLTDEQSPQIRAARNELGIFASETQLANFLRYMGYATAGTRDASPPSSAGPSETEEEQRARLSGDCQRLASRYIATRWGVKNRSDRDQYERLIKLVNSDLNRHQGLRSSKSASPAQLRERKRILLAWINDHEGVA